MDVEVHQQESNVGGHVGIPESPVKLDAIEDENLLGQADVLQMKVAVAIADLSSGDALIKEGKLILHEEVGTLFDFPETFCREGKPQVLFGLAEILFKVMPNGVDRTKRSDLGVRLGLGVKVRDLGGNFMQEGRGDVSPGQPSLHHAVLGKLPH